MPRSIFSCLCIVCQTSRTLKITSLTPFAALEKLDSQRTSCPPSNTDARLALQWLDEITTATANKTAGFVQLQGPDDQYMSWQEVERYLLPETPLSAHDGHESLDGLNEAFAKSLETRMSNRLSTEVENDDVVSTFKSGSQPSTPVSGEEKRGKKHAGKRVRNIQRIRGGRKYVANHSLPTAAIPSRFRPLLNFVVWRTYHFDLSTSSAGTYVLLTNDSTTQKLAQKFGVRAKMLSQVRTIVAKDGAINTQDEELHGNEEDATQDAAGDDGIIDAVGDMRAVDERDEDEVIYVPPSSSQALQENIKTTVIDPNHFGRDTTRITLAAPGVSPPNAAHSTSPPKPSAPSKTAPSQPRARSQPSSPNPAKRTPATNTNRHSNSHAQSRTASRGANANNLGAVGSMRGMGRQTVAPMPLPQVPRLVKPIDPDSYARPPPIGARGGRGGRGGSAGGRRLWEP